MYKINLPNILDTQDTKDYSYLLCVYLLFQYLEENPLSLPQTDRALAQLESLAHHYLKTEGWYTEQEFKQEVFNRMDKATVEYDGDFDPICEPLF